MIRSRRVIREHNPYYISDGGAHVYPFCHVTLLALFLLAGAVFGEETTVQLAVNNASSSHVTAHNQSWSNTQPTVSEEVTTSITKEENWIGDIDTDTTGSNLVKA